MTMTAAGLAAALTVAQGPSQDLAIQAAANLAMATGIITYLTTAGTVTIPAGTIVTNGGPTTQSGPPANLPLLGAFA